MKTIRIAQLGMGLLGTTIASCFLIAQLTKAISLPLLAGETLAPTNHRDHSNDNAWSQLPHAQIISALTQADIVYLGETHNSVEDHAAQLEIIAALYENNRRVAIALEMFQRPYQSVLDQYIAQEISEDELRTQTEYDSRWGFEWEYYAPILRFARAHRLPLLALNTPTEVTRKVAREGLTSLSASERRAIPSFSDIRTDNEEYRQMIRDVYEQSHGGHTGNFENFFTAQVLWDETMAETVAQFWQANQNHQVIVLAGQGHIVYGYGIPSRVARRTGNAEQATVLLGTAPDLMPEPAADFLWNHE